MCPQCSRRAKKAAISTIINSAAPHGRRQGAAPLGAELSLCAVWSMFMSSQRMCEVTAHDELEPFHRWNVKSAMRVCLRPFGCGHDITAPAQAGTVLLSADRTRSSRERASFATAATSGRRRRVAPPACKLRRQAQQAKCLLGSSGALELKPEANGGLFGNEHGPGMAPRRNRSERESMGDMVRHAHTGSTTAPTAATCSVHNKTHASARQGR